METSNGPSCLLQLIISSSYHCICQFHIKYHCTSCSQPRAMFFSHHAPYLSYSAQKKALEFLTRCCHIFSQCTLELSQFIEYCKVHPYKEKKIKKSFSNLQPSIPLNIIQHQDLVTCGLVNCFPPLSAIHYCLFPNCYNFGIDQSFSSINMLSA